MPDALQILAIGGKPPRLARSPWGPYKLHACASLDEAARRLAAERFDALLFIAAAGEAERLAAWPALSHAVLDAAVVVVMPDPAPALAASLLHAGVQDLLSSQEGGDDATLARRLRLAIERKAAEKAARKSHATDLATGLPNHAQLLEHMSQLLALREREPAPMALLAVRIEGLAVTEAQLGAESANVLRRKVAVRLRAALRASDVVAAIGVDAFVVLLAWIDAPGDGERVAAKLARALHRPFSVTGHEVAVGTAIGFSLYPEHGKDADTLLRRAIGQASSAATQAGAGFGNALQRAADTAANDDEA